MTDVFISYSRKDSDFVRRIHEALAQRKRDVWVDWEDIPLTANWWREICEGIEAADNFIFVLTPDSIASPICNFEIAHAIKHNKRIVPIVRHEVNEIEAFAKLASVRLNEGAQEILGKRDLISVGRESWAALARHNWVLFTDDSTFDETFERFLDVLDKDLEHAKVHTRLLIRALEWDRITHNASFLLTGDEIESAEAWLASSDKAQKSPPPTSLHREYISASRLGERARKRRIRNLQMVSVFAGVVGIVAILSTIVATIEVRAATSNSATIQAQVGTAEERIDRIIATSTSVVGTQVANVEAVLVQVAAAEAQAGISNTSVAVAEEKLMTATQALITATQVSRLEAEAQGTLASVSTQVAAALVTVTHAAIDQEITRDFANIMLQEAENPAAQVAAMNDLVERFPEQPLVYLSRGLIHFSQGNIQEAIDDFDRAIELDPQFNSVAYVARGDIYSEQGDFEAAIVDYGRAILLNPSDVNAYVARGNVHSAIGNYQAAILDFTHTIEIDPEFSMGYFSRANTYYQLQNYESAIMDFSRSIELNPTFSYAYNNRGNVYRDMGDEVSALSDYSTALEIDTQYAEPHNNLAVIYQHQGDLDSALQQYDLAIDLDPQNSLFISNRATALYAMGDSQAALLDLDQAIIIDPENADAYNNRCFFRTSETTEHEIALKDCDLAIQLDPSNYAYYDSRCLVKNNLGDYLGAIQDCDFAIALFPGSIESYLNLGNAYYALEEYSNALANYRIFHDGAVPEDIPDWLEERILEIQAGVDSN